MSARLSSYGRLRHHGLLHAPCLQWILPSAGPLDFDFWALTQAHLFLGFFDAQGVNTYFLIGSSLWTFSSHLCLVLSLVIVHLFSICYQILVHCSGLVLARFKGRDLVTLPVPQRNRPGEVNLTSESGLLPLFDAAAKRSSCSFLKGRVPVPCYTFHFGSLFQILFLFQDFLFACNAILAHLVLTKPVATRARGLTHMTWFCIRPILDPSKLIRNGNLGRHTSPVFKRHVLAETTFVRPPSLYEKPATALFLVTSSQGLSHTRANHKPRVVERPSWGLLLSLSPSNLRMMSRVCLISCIAPRDLLLLGFKSPQQGKP